MERRISRLRGSTAPSGVAVSLPLVRARRAERARTARPYGVAAIPLHIAMAGGWQPQSGSPPLRAQRVLKGKGLIRKKGKTAGVPLLVRSAAAQAEIQPAMRGHFPTPCKAVTVPKGTGKFRNAFQGDILL